MRNNLPFNEGEVVCRLVKGDMQAFEELYWKYQKAVYRNAFKFTQDVEVAEDIVQEVFISLWEKRDSIDPGRSVAGWLFVSSYNRSITALKKRLKESLAYRKLEHAITKDEAEQDLSALQLCVLEKAIAQLSPQRRRVFELCKLQGKTYEEAAAELNISRHTVKEYQAGAIQFIKEYVRTHPDIREGIVYLLLLGSL